MDLLSMLRNLIEPSPAFGEIIPRTKEEYDLLNNAMNQSPRGGSVATAIEKPEKYRLQNIPGQWTVAGFYEPDRGLIGIMPERDMQSKGEINWLGNKYPDYAITPEETLSHEVGHVLARLAGVSGVGGDFGQRVAGYIPYDRELTADIIASNPTEKELGALINKRLAKNYSALSNPFTGLPLGELFDFYKDALLNTLGDRANVFMGPPRPLPKVHKPTYFPYERP